MDHFIAIFNWLKIVCSLVLGIALVIFSIISYIKTKGGFTPSDPQDFLINYVRYYDERVLIFLIIAGGVLIFYGLYGFYAEYCNRLGKQ